MSDSINQSNMFLRNPVTAAGTGILCGAATVAGVVALSVAPRTTIGLSALGAGLVAAGNAEQLKQWGDSFGSK